MKQESPSLTKTLIVAVAPSLPPTPFLRAKQIGWWQTNEPALKRLHSRPDLGVQTRLVRKRRFYCHFAYTRHDENILSQPELIPTSIKSKEMAPFVNCSKAANFIADVLEH